MNTKTSKSASKTHNCMKLEINIKGNTGCCFKETYQPSPTSDLTKISQILSGGLTFGKDWETAVLRKKKKGCSAFVQKNVVGL
jgi:hypothetical protein